MDRVAEMISRTAVLEFPANPDEPVIRVRVCENCGRSYDPDEHLYCPWVECSGEREATTLHLPIV